MIIRQANSADAAALAALYRELVNDPLVNVLPEQLDFLAQHPDHALLVVEHHEVLVGTAHLMFCLDAMFGTQPYGLLENVVVTAQQRGTGIDKALMREIDQHCMSRGCSKIMLLSSATRHEAHEFFRRAGFNSETKLGFVKYRRDFAHTQRLETA